MRPVGHKDCNKQLQVVRSVASGRKFYWLQCSTLMLVHLPRTSENSCWASKNVLLLAPRPVTLVDKNKFC